MSYDQKALEKLFAPKPAEPNLSSISETVADNSTVHTNGFKEIVNLHIADLTDYPKLLFKPYTEEKLNRLETSIKENGVIEPLIVRHFDVKYQIVCGHNRRTAAAQAGFEIVPCIVEELSDDDADIKMVETNLQVRAGLLPSEKGFAYRLKLEALKHQGVRTDLTSTTTVVEVKGRSVRRIMWPSLTVQASKTFSVRAGMKLNLYFRKPARIRDIKRRCICQSSQQFAAS